MTFARNTKQPPTFSVNFAICHWTSNLWMQSDCAKVLLIHDCHATLIPSPEDGPVASVLVRPCARLLQPFPHTHRSPVMQKMEIWPASTQAWTKCQPQASERERRVLISPLKNHCIFTCITHNPLSLLTCWSSYQGYGICFMSHFEIHYLYFWKNIFYALQYTCTLVTPKGDCSVIEFSCHSGL